MARPQARPDGTPRGDTHRGAEKEQENALIAAQQIDWDRKRRAAQLIISDSSCSPGQPHASDTVLGRRNADPHPDRNDLPHHRRLGARHRDSNPVKHDRRGAPVSGRHSRGKSRSWHTSQVRAHHRHPARRHPERQRRMRPHIHDRDGLVRTRRTVRGPTRSIERDVNRSNPACCPIRDAQAALNPKQQSVGQRIALPDQLHTTESSRGQRNPGRPLAHILTS